MKRKENCLPYRLFLAVTTFAVYEAYADFSPTLATSRNRFFSSRYVSADDVYETLRAILRAIDKHSARDIRTLATLAPDLYRVACLYSMLTKEALAAFAVEASSEFDVSIKGNKLCQLYGRHNILIDHLNHAGHKIFGHGVFSAGFRQA